MLLFEKISHFFFMKRLRRRMRSLYKIEDPWDSAFLSEVFEPVLREQLQSLPEDLRGSPVLDAGGGEGLFFTRLRDQLPCYYLADLDEEACRRAREKVGGSPHRVLCQSLDRLNLPEESCSMLWLISVITCLGAARHPRLYRQTLFRLWSFLKPGGSAVLIHPYYSESEQAFLRASGGLLTGLGGEVVLSEEKQVGKQSFLVEVIRKT